MTGVEWIFVILSMVWISEFIFFRNRGVGEEDPHEKRTFLLILLALLGTIALSVSLQEMKQLEASAYLIQVPGAVLFGAGVFLRLWGIIHLKNQFTRNVTVRDGDEIVSTGPYRRLRHPLYTGLLMISLGMSLFFMSIVGAVFGALIVSWTLMKRIRYEEDLLIEKFGLDYKQWMSKRARLFPFIY
ncbi:isoprenylcysteine carboxylmethyltransferase family protein [Jeotgalibacillus sp. S-D1]|nr:isoprenylcysteine carboxylmethyltransferase family protein [Jeotgalibacillus sp. S-D1]